MFFASPSISFYEYSTSSAGELSGSTNTVLPKNPSISFDEINTSGLALLMYGRARHNGRELNALVAKLF